MADLKDTEIDEIRSTVRRIIADNKHPEVSSQTQASELSGVAYSTAAAFLGGAYTGDNQKVAAKFKIWLDSLSEKATAPAKVEIPKFLPTKTAKKVTEVLRFAQGLPEISVFAGGAGIGKTSAAKEYVATHPNVWMVTMDPSTNTPAALLRELAVAMHLSEGQPGKFKRAIVQRVTSSAGLIIVDESQYLTPNALDMLRAIYDAADGSVGIALLGNQEVTNRLRGGVKSNNFAQVHSRIGMHISQPNAYMDDINTLIARWGISDAAEVEKLRVIARRPGALRSLTKTLQLATMTANHQKEKINEKHIKNAYERLASKVA